MEIDRGHIAAPTVIQCLWAALGIDTGEDFLSIAPVMDRVGFRAIDFTHLDPHGSGGAV